MKIIILNCYSRNALAVINSLDAQYDLIGGAEQKTNFVLANPDKLFKSRRLKTIFRYTDPTRSLSRFQNDIITACKKYQADVILAAGTTLTNSLSKIKPAIANETNTIALVEDYDKLIQIADKWNSYQIFRRLGIPAPKTMLIENAQESLEALGLFRFPVVVKPRDSFAAKGVARFDTFERFESFLKSLTEKGNHEFGKLIAQEAIEGDLHDVTSCSKDGEVISMLSQQRLMTLYDFGGGGIINVTTRNQEIMEYAEKIISYLRWNGIMEFDFIESVYGEFFILECNPKFWGTTQLTVSAGLNMPQQLIDHLYLEKPLPASKPEYEDGLIYKWYFPECVYHWFTEPRNIFRVSERIKKTFKRYGQRPSMHNLHTQNVAHLLGIFINKTKL